MGRSKSSKNPIFALAAEYNFMRMTDGDKHIAQVILKNIKKLPELTAERAAEMCSVSVSTFHRFCRNMGYDSFSEFKFKLGDALDKYPFNSVLLPEELVESGGGYVNAMTSALKNDIDNFIVCLDRGSYRRAAEYVINAESIFIHDARYSTNRLLFQGDMAVMGKMVYFAPDSDQQEENLKKMNSKGVLISVVDGTPRSKDILEAMYKAKDTGVKNITVSPAPGFKYHEVCDAVLITGRSVTAVGMGIQNDLAFQVLTRLVRGGEF